MVLAYEKFDVEKCDDHHGLNPLEQNPNGYQSSCHLVLSHRRCGRCRYDLVGVGARQKIDRTAVC